MLFSKIYNIILKWAEHKNAKNYLMFLSFVEAFILPYPPPDILLAPMVLKNPSQKYQLALITAIFSILGGLCGYLIGYWLFDFIMPYIELLNYGDKLVQLQLWFDKYGIWTIFIAGFSPIPYKLFTILAGFLSMALIPFLVISLISRWLRFVLVAIIVARFGNTCDVWLKKYIDVLGYVIILAFIIYLI